MLQTHTVENYLKAIFQAQSGLKTAEALVPMGQLSSALEVVPGTATTMVKALAESGLVRYEPYAGVRLTQAGERLAALVLRRHRLIELFLVKVMGMSWTEVHGEAEHLEHAVSDRLIERIDEMLGRPEVDPHGDPIPDPEGTVRRLDYDTLLTCPLNALVTVSRVSDQDSEFLKFVERHDLKPGESVWVEARDAAGDSVRLRGRDDRQVTIGARAASKVLVQTARILVAWLLLSSGALAQTTATPVAMAVEPFQIMDNSFLVEEAFNQPDGIFQNIFTAARLNGRWGTGFTQEWPVASQRHQLSYTVSYLDVGSRSGFGDGLINYRYQASNDAPGSAAFSPRVSVILPTGNRDDGLGDGSMGLQFNLPVSKQISEWHLHWNAGLTWLPRAKGDEGSGGSRGRARENLVSPFLAGSAIYRLHPMLYLMLESVVSFDHFIVDGGKARDTAFTLSPGVRGGWNLGDHQLVLGLAAPTTWGDTRDTGVFTYLSYELPFGR